ncbi:MAG TPA: hypothetical protein VFS43_04085 [Polyangiaceae bacterium]|nr:hypothetical protein [Polyangiaceae bacterium]
MTLPTSVIEENAMQREVLDKSAIAFAHELYKGLAAGLSIAELVASGRLGVAQSDPLGWGTPVLYLRDGIIFPESAVDAGSERARRDLRGRVSQVASLMYGKLTGIKAAASTLGEPSARQQVGEVSPNGEVVGSELK